MLLSFFLRAMKSNSLFSLFGFLFFSSLFIQLLSPSQARAYFYPESYEESRNHLDDKVKILKNTYPDLIQEAYAISSDLSDDLKTDFVVIPSLNKKSKKLIIISSGIHGVEAFTGSALQFSLLDSDDLKNIIKDSSLMIVHAVNPYGYSFKRRVSENNVDLNRNFLLDKKLYEQTNPKYNAFHSFLNPQNPLKMGRFEDLKLFVSSLLKLIFYGRKELSQIILSGQYEKEKGIYFGGSKAEPQMAMMKEALQRWTTDKEQVLHIDLHTGYGERGRLHFFSSRKATEIPGFNEIFKGYSIDLGEDEDFYTTSGGFEKFTVQFLAHKKVIPMTFEFGTMDSQTIIGGFYSLRNMIFENQGFHYGYKDENSKKLIQSDFLEMFNPSDPEWRKKVITDGTSTLLKVSQRFGQVDFKSVE